MPVLALRMPRPLPSVLSVPAVGSSPDSGAGRVGVGRTGRVVDFDEIRRAAGVPADFPPEVLAEAESVAAAPPAPGPDHTDLPLVTIDPLGSRDLDQAMYLERVGSGFRVWYAIADVSAWVRPGGAIDAEAHRRGETLYCPDRSIPLHPPRLSQGAASLLPGQTCPAVLWTIDLDADGMPGPVDVRRATVRSVARLDYDGIQADAAAGRLHPSIEALPDIGRLRSRAARARHAITLNLPDAEVEPAAAADGGGWTLRLRAVGPLEDANAEISLLTGICAASIMLAGGIGLLRTLPPPDEAAIAELRRSARALGIDWAPGELPGDVGSRVDAGTGRGAAFLEDAVRLLRGAGYAAFDGAPPAQTGHAGVGAPYAHVTAPLRRLADRFATETCLALHAGSQVPAWVRDGLGALPAEMAAGGHRAADLDRACTWAVTALLLADRVGRSIPGRVVQIDGHGDRATVLLTDPPVRTHCRAAGLTEGQDIVVRVDGIDDAGRQVQVSPVGTGSAMPGVPAGTTPDGVAR